MHQIADLRGKTIGVISLGGGVLFAKALISMAGMDPEKDVKFVVAGEGAQTAAMVRSRQVDALCQFDAQYALVENAGIRLRMLNATAIERFPGNGFFALNETLRAHKTDAIALARGYAKGTIFAINNPEAAVRVLYEVFPEARPTGKDEATAVRDDVRVLQARMPNWRLEKSGVNRWGESSLTSYAEYLDFLLKWGVIKEKVGVKDLVTNELIDDVNTFDSNKIAAMARAYRFN
jgi:NitT/TauT family transport system substrate-binding protein